MPLAGVPVPSKLITLLLTRAARAQRSIVARAQNKVDNKLSYLLSLINSYIAMNVDATPTPSNLGTFALLSDTHLDPFYGTPYAEIHKKGAPCNLTKMHRQIQHTDVADHQIQSPLPYRLHLLLLMTTSKIGHRLILYCLREIILVITLKIHQLFCKVSQLFKVYSKSTSRMLQ